MLILKQKLKLCGYAIEIFACFAIFGLLQEKIFRVRYGDEIADDGINGERYTMAITFSAIQCIFFVLFAKALTFTHNHPENETSQSYYALIGVFNIGASVIANMSLQWVPYLTQIIGRSCKPIPVMILGVLIGRKTYSYRKVLLVLTIVMAVMLFMSKGEYTEKDGDNALLGNLLLDTSLLFDGLCGAFRDRMRSIKKPAPLNFMMYVNCWSLIFLLVGIVVFRRTAAAKYFAISGCFVTNATNFGASSTIFIEVKFVNGISGIASFKLYHNRTNSDLNMAIDLTKICRLSLKSVKSEKELIDIFKNDENCSLPMRIMACSALEVNQSDALPNNMCKECRYGLEKCYLFRKKSTNADTKLRRHLRLVNAGKVSNVFEEEDDDTEECQQSIAFLAKWDDEQTTKQNAAIDDKYQLLRRQWNQEKRKWESEKQQWDLDKMLLHKKAEQLVILRREKEEEYQKLLSQTQTQAFEVDNNFGELIIKNEPNVKDKQMKECDSTEMEGEEYSATLMVLESTDNYENYEMITDETNNYTSMFDNEEEEEESQGVNVIERDQTNYILSGNDDEIEISFAEAEVDIDSGKEDDEDYTNTEYLEIDDEDAKEDVEVFPLEFSSMTKVIRVIRAHFVASFTMRFLCMKTEFKVFRPEHSQLLNLIWDD